MKFLTLCFAGVAMLASLSVRADETTLRPFQVVRMSYASTNVTTSAWTQLVANMSGLARTISVFDSSGQTMVLGTGAVGSEVAQTWYIFPGGLQLIPITIPANSRLVVKAISSTASSGEIDINFYQ